MTILSSFKKKHTWQTLTSLLSTLSEDKKEEKSSEWEPWLVLFPQKTKKILQNEEVDKAFVAKMCPKTDLQNTKVQFGSLSPIVQWFYQYPLKNQDADESQFQPGLPYCLQLSLL